MPTFHSPDYQLQSQYEELSCEHLRPGKIHDYLNPPMSCQSHLWKQKLVIKKLASWPEVWNCARARHFLWVIASLLVSVPMEICKRSSHHKIPQPQFLLLEPLYCWSLMETVQTIKKLLQLNQINVVMIWPAINFLCHCWLGIPNMTSNLDLPQILTFLHHFNLCLVQWSSHWLEVRGEQNQTSDVWVASPGLKMRGNIITTVI